MAGHVLAAGIIAPPAPLFAGRVRPHRTSPAGTHADQSQDDQDALEAGRSPVLSRFCPSGQAAKPGIRLNLSPRSRQVSSANRILPLRAGRQARHPCWLIVTRPAGFLRAGLPRRPHATRRPIHADQRSTPPDQSAPTDPAGKASRRTRDEAKTPAAKCPENQQPAGATQPQRLRGRSQSGTPPVRASMCSPQTGGGKHPNRKPQDRNRCAPRKPFDNSGKVNTAMMLLNFSSFGRKTPIPSRQKIARASPAASPDRRGRLYFHTRQVFSMKTPPAFPLRKEAAAWGAPRGPKPPLSTDAANSDRTGGPQRDSFMGSGPVVPNDSWPKGEESSANPTIKRPAKAAAAAAERIQSRTQPARLAGQSKATRPYRHDSIAPGCSPAP